MKLVNIDLSEMLGEGQYVNIRDPRYLPWAETRKIQMSMKDQSVESQAQFSEQLVISLVKNGNVLDEYEQPIAFPITADSIGSIPSAMMEAVIQKFTEIKQKGVNLPNK